MAAVNIWNSLASWAKSAWSSLSGIPSDIGHAASHIWSFITSVAQVMDWIIRNPFKALTIEVGGLVDLLTGNVNGFLDSQRRMAPWMYANQTLPTRALAWRLYRQAIAQLHSSIALTIQWARAMFAATRRYAAALVARERKARIAAVRAARAYARQLDKALHQAIEREAASGYVPSANAQVDLITRLLEEIAGRDPALRAVTGRVATLVADLLGAESLPERLLAGFLVTRLADHLGVDAPIADFTHAVLGPLIGDPKPHDLHGVIAALSGRVGALEDQWAQFYADGGAQLLQQGQGWKDLTSLGLDAALVGFAAAAIADPAGTASAFGDATRPLGTDTIAHIASVIGRG